MPDEIDTTDENFAGAGKIADEGVQETHTPDESDEGTQETSTPDDEPDTFDRAYVQKLRDENAKYRQRAGKADELAQRLHSALVAASGKLADASDLPFDAEHLDDDGSRLREAIDALLARKPHLAARRPIGEIGQGATTSSSTVDLAGLLRARAT